MVRTRCKFRLSSAELSVPLPQHTAQGVAEFCLTVLGCEMFTYSSSGGQQILPNLALANLQTQYEWRPVLVHFLSLQGVSHGRKQESEKSVHQDGRGLFLLVRV